MTLAGFKPAGVLCELTNDDGTMARAPECIEFANKHNMALVTIEDRWHTVRHMSVKPAENRCLIYCLNQETEVVAGFGFIFFPAMQDVNSASLSMRKFH